MQFNVLLGFRVGFRDRFKDKFWNNFTTIGDKKFGHV